MNEPSDKKQDWESLRKKVIGLGEESIRKSYYPELQQRLKELQESEAKFRDIFDRILDMIFVQDAEDYTLVDVNQHACDVCGYTREEFLHTDFVDICTGEWPYTQELAKELCDKAVAGEPQFYEWRIKDRSGRGIWIEGSLSLTIIGGEKRLLFVGRDITAKKQTEEEKHVLEQSLEEQKRKFYRQIILSVTEGKLEICDEEDVLPFIENAAVGMDIHEAMDASLARQEISGICGNYGLKDERLHQMTIAAGEIITNAIKHAQGGRVYAGKTDNEVWVGAVDNGRGIESLILPSAVLRRGFSTKPSLGLGYSIILDACDRVLLKTDTDGTTVILLKNLGENNIPPLSTIADVWETLP
jgi:PAS domain S-box-containing protein